MGCIVWLRACFLEHLYELARREASPESCTVFRGLVYFAWFSIPFIILMGWTDGINNRIQAYHFVSAIIGLGILSVYCIGNALLLLFLCIQIYIKRDFSNISQPRFWLLFGTAIYYCIMGATTPVTIVMWVVGKNSIYEWIGVGCLFVYVIPYFMDFVLYGQFDTNSNLEQTSLLDTESAN